LSQEATFIRLVELEYLDRSEYINWKSQFSDSIPIGDKSSSGGGGKPNPIQAKRTQFGFSLLKALESAKAQGEIDEIEIYHLIRLKPKYQRELFVHQEAASV